MARASYKVLKDGKQVGTVVGYGKTYAAALATARRLAGAVTRAANPVRKRRKKAKRKKAKRRTTRAQVRRRRAKIRRGGKKRATTRRRVRR